MPTRCCSRPSTSGTEDFQPTNLEVTSIDVGNPAVNVIPAKATAGLQHPLQRHLDAPRPSRPRSTTGSTGRRADDSTARPARTPVDYDLVWRDRPSHVFLTRDDRLIATLGRSIEAVTGRTPKLSTSGGTSDARFIKDYCPVVEFGLVGKTMHMVDERVALADLETLTEIYQPLPRGLVRLSMPRHRGNPAVPDRQPGA